MQSGVLGIILAGLVIFSFAQADEFTKTDLELWQSEYQEVVKKGRQVFTDPGLGTNGVVCAQCHPNGANTHPETYPKFQKQLGKVATLGEMINFCIRNPLEGKDLVLDDRRMIALQAYIAEERRGVKLAPGKH
ncbi:MAG: cytochrome C [Thermodesulfobacteriota bacterium]|nr:cytochrome C [Thermodesulfobacteriota bacterium]